MPDGEIVLQPLPIVIISYHSCRLFYARDTCLSVHALVRLSVCSFIRSFICSSLCCLVRAFVGSFLRMFVPSYVRSFIRSVVCLCSCLEDFSGLP